MLMLARKFANYRLHIVGITQNKEKCLISLYSLKAGKNLIRLDQKEENSTKKFK